MSPMLDVLLPIGGNSNIVKNVNSFPLVSLVTTQLALHTLQAYLISVDTVY